MKNFNNFTIVFILDKALLRLNVHILSKKYLEDRIFCFIKITEHDNINFNYQIIEDDNNKKNGKKAITDLEKKRSKKKAYYKKKKDML